MDPAAGYLGPSTSSNRIEVPANDCSANQVNVFSSQFRLFDAGETDQQVFFKRSQFGFFRYHSKVVALKIVIRDMRHYEP